MQTEGYTIFTRPLKNSNKKAENNPANKDTDLVKKVDHTNKNTLDGKYVAKILNSEDDHLRKYSYNLAPTMPHELRIAIAQARNAKGLNQEQFAKLIQVPKADVNAWEAGKAVPPGAFIAKMEKALGVKLPRPAKN